ASLNRDHERHFDFRMKRQRDFISADRLDRRIEHDLRAVDLAPVGLNQTGNVTGRYRTEQLSGLACLPQDHVALAVELATKLACFALHLEVARLQFGLLLL